MKQPTKIQFSSVEEALQYIQNPKNYKVAYTKSHMVWCALPSEPMKCTNYYNRLKGYDVGTTPYKPFIVSGTRGQMWTASSQELMRNYALVNGEHLTEKYLDDMRKQGAVDWFPLKFDRKEKHFACFVPEAYCFTIPQKDGTELEINGKGLVHGFGDFVVCPSVKDKPDLSRIKVVNGVIFADTYNNNGWQAMLNPNKAQVISEIPALVVVARPQQTGGYSYITNDGVRMYHTPKKEQGMFSGADARDMIPTGILFRLWHRLQGTYGRYGAVACDKIGLANKDLMRVNDVAVKTVGDVVYPKKWLDSAILRMKQFDAIRVYFDIHAPGMFEEALYECIQVQAQAMTILRESELPNSDTISYVFSVGNHLAYLDNLLSPQASEVGWVSKLDNFPINIMTNLTAKNIAEICSENSGFGVTKIEMGIAETKHTKPVFISGVLSNYNFRNIFSQQCVKYKDALAKRGADMKWVADWISNFPPVNIDDMSIVTLNEIVPAWSRYTSLISETNTVGLHEIREQSTPLPRHDATGLHKPSKSMNRNKAVSNP